MYELEEYIHMEIKGEILDFCNFTCKKFNDVGEMKWKM